MHVTMTGSEDSVKPAAAEKSVCPATAATHALQLQLTRELWSSSKDFPNESLRFRF